MDQKNKLLIKKKKNQTTNVMKNCLIKVVDMKIMAIRYLAVITPKLRFSVQKGDRYFFITLGFI